MITNKLNNKVWLEWEHIKPKQNKRKLLEMDIPTSMRNVRVNFEMKIFG